MSYSVSVVLTLQGKDTHDFYCVVLFDTYLTILPKTFDTLSLYCTVLCGCKLLPRKLSLLGM